MRIEVLCSLVANIIQNRVHMYMYFSGVFMYIVNVVRFVCDIMDDIGTFMCL